MQLSESTKLAALEAGEEVLKVALEQSLKVAEALAADSESEIDDSVVAGIKMLKSAFLDGLVEKINPAD